MYTCYSDAVVTNALLVLLQTRIAPKLSLLLAYRVRHLSLVPFSVMLMIIRPNVQFFCDLHYDPFLVMEDGNKVYGE